MSPQSGRHDAFRTSAHFASSSSSRAMLPDSAAPLLHNGASDLKPDTPLPLDEAAPHSAAPCTDEAKRVLALALPVSAAEILSFASYLVTTSMIGQVGAQALSAFTLARTVYHITGLSLVVGLVSGQDTFSGQAFGAGQFRLLGVFLQRAVLIAALSTAGRPLFRRRALPYRHTPTPPVPPHSNVLILILIGPLLPLLPPPPPPLSQPFQD
ncbi:hypothetical protein V8C86DRAFT_3183346 [Haematococcus lacustris]